MNLKALSWVFLAAFPALPGCHWGPNRSFWAPPNEPGFPGLVSQKRLVVLKTFDAYGDYTDTDAPLVTKLCLARYNGSISQEQFDADYSVWPVRLISGPPIKYNIEAEIDDRENITEVYYENISVPSYIDGVPMNDGKSMPVKKQREVMKGKLRHVYAECTAFEYHF